MKEQHCIFISVLSTQIDNCWMLSSKKWNTKEHSTLCPFLHPFVYNNPRKDPLKSPPATSLQFRLWLWQHFEVHQIHDPWQNVRQKRALPRVVLLKGSMPLEWRVETSSLAVGRYYFASERHYFKTLLGAYCKEQFVKFRSFEKPAA